MSLEQAVKENTEAIRELIAALKTQGATCAASVPVVAQPAQPKEAAAETKVEEPLKYEAIQKPFLKLANKDRPAAVALLAQLGVKKLDGVKTEQYAEVLSLIEEQLNG